MAQLNFHATFAPLVESGSKRQTIRAQRKRPIEIGENLHLFTGLRQKGARRLLPPQTCMLAVNISMRWYQRSGYDCFECKLNGKKLTVSEIQDLATKDGFPSLDAFKAWFLPKGTTSFIGQLIQW
jgi:hypothetical protein